MTLQSNRRQFLRTAAAVGLADLGILGQLPSVSADDAKLDPKVVRLDPEIEPLVRLLEETPRDRAARRSRGPHQEGDDVPRGAGRPAAGRRAQRRAAAERRVQVPRRAGGQLGPPGQPRLPRLRALAADLLGPRQLQGAPRPGTSRSATAGGCRRSRSRRVPPARKARQAFIEAMENWDAEAADVAVAGLARTAGADEVIELFWKYAAARLPLDRPQGDLRRQHAADARRSSAGSNAEPVLRSLAYALMSSGNGNPAKADDPADRPGRRNRELAEGDPRGLARRQARRGRDDRPARARSARRRAEEASKAVVGMLNKGVSPQSIWDAILAGSGELLMRRPGIRRCTRSRPRTPCASPSRRAATTRRGAGCSCRRPRSCRCSAARSRRARRSLARREARHARADRPEGRPARRPWRRSSPTCRRTSRRRPARCSAT